MLYYKGNKVPIRPGRPGISQNVGTPRAIIDKKLDPDWTITDETLDSDRAIIDETVWIYVSFTRYPINKRRRRLDLQSSKCSWMSRRCSPKPGASACDLFISGKLVKGFVREEYSVEFDRVFIKKLQELKIILEHYRYYRKRLMFVESRR